MTLPELVRHTGTYLFEGQEGVLTLADLFAGYRRLAVHHTMPDHCPPGEEVPAGLLSGFEDTRLVLVTRAPYAKLAQYRRHLGWDLPCYAQTGTFTDDFPATRRLAGTPPGPLWGDVPGLSFFVRDSGAVRHAGSVAVPGLDFLVGAWNLRRR